MGKNQKLELPEPPKYKTDPIFDKGYNELYNYGSQLSKGDLTGNLAWLSPTIDNNNSALALSAAQGTLEPQFRDTLTKIRNEAAANGQLESSTFTDALARSQSDLNSQYQSIVSQQAINDSNNSNAARLSLFGTGLQTLNQATAFGQGNQNSENQFNLSNYDNLVAQAIQKNNNANMATGFQQVLGFSPLGHDYLQSQGITNVPGYGVADVAKIAGSFYGMGGMGGLSGGGTGPFGNSLNSTFRTGASAPGAGAYAMNSSNPYVGNQVYGQQNYGLLN